MGTETFFGSNIISPQSNQIVKLNNPLMGTETASQSH